MSHAMADILCNNEPLNIFRSSRQEVFYKKDVLKVLVKFSGKHPCRSLFLINTQADNLQLYQKQTPAMCFPVNLAKSLKIAFCNTLLGNFSCTFECSSIP